jgi:diguanylate cyclase (GGDEF)-like protein
MTRNWLEELNNNKEIPAHFDFLKRIGIWDQVLLMDRDIRNMDQLLDKIIELFNKHILIDLIEYVSNLMLEKFVPSYLAFIIHDEEIHDGVQSICFENMKRIDHAISISSLDPYNEYFVNHAGLVTFAEFERRIGNKALTDPFLPLDPELIVPLLSREGLFGFIVFGTKVIGTPYSAQEVDYVDRIMKFASASLRNNINYQKAIIDAKTRLYTYDHFSKRLKEELARVKRHGIEVSLVMIDIDRFKALNDEFGHLAGDRILARLGEVLAGNIREGDIACRYGGDELAVLLVYADAEKAYQMAERLRLRVEAMPVDYLGNTLHITISCGIAHASAKDYLGVQELISRSDKALYRSKQEGRNRTTLWPGASGPVTA